MPEREPRNQVEAFADAFINVLDAPVTWFRGWLFSLNPLEFTYFCFSQTTVTPALKNTIMRTCVSISIRLFKSKKINCVILFSLLHRKGRRA